MDKVPSVTVCYELDPKSHELTQVPDTAVRNLIQNGNKKRKVQLVFSGFKDPDNPSTPTKLKYNQATHQNPLVDYFHFEFAPISTNDLDNLYKKVNEIFKEYDKPDLVFYQGDDNHWHLVIQLERLLTKPYLEKAEQKFIEVQHLSQFNLLKSVKISTPLEPINAEKSIQPVTHENYILFQGLQHSMGISDEYLNDLNVDDSSSKPGTNGGSVYTEESLKAGFKAYTKDKYNFTQFKNASYRDDFWLSLLVTLQKFTCRDEFIQNVIDTMSADEGKDIKNQYLEEVEQTQKKLENNPRFINIAKSIADYFPLYRGDEDDENKLPVHNLSDQLKNALGDKFISDPKLKLEQAADEIKSIYPPYLIKQAGVNRDNVVIFNPLNGIWTHDDDLFHILLSTVKPYHTKQDFDRMMQEFADDAATGDRYIEPYSGSKYLLFDNGCLDVTSMELYKLDSPLVRNLHFTDRCHLHIDYVDDPDLPIIPNGKIDNGGDWNPDDFIRAYANNDNDTLDFFLFGLSLGLFGGHNFGVHFDIQGQSRWGKSTLSEIYKNLYTSNQVSEISYPNLNKRFPFNNYNINTSVIWISEANAGVKPLNDDQGTLIYDKLADGQVSFEVKGKKDIIVNNPPQVYIDGTQLIQANNLATGPAGRTLAYELPPMTNKLREQFYGNDINHFLADTRVLQWLIYQMITAYRKTVPDYKQASFQMNLNVKENIAMLPDIAKKWREDLVTDNSDLSDWFINDFEPYLTNTTNQADGNATIMHMQIAYNILYDHYYIQFHQHDKNRIKMKSLSKFEREFAQVVDQNGWRMVPVGSKNGREKTLRKKVSDYHAINFNWDDYFSDNGKLKKLEDASNLPEPFKRKRPNWFKLVKVPDADK